MSIMKILTQYATTIRESIMTSLDIDPDTFATIFITLFVFIVGLIIQQLIVFYNSYIQRKRTRKVFELSLDSFINQAKKQSEEYIKTSQTFSFEKETRLYFSPVTISSISLLNELGYQKAYEAYFFGFENLFKLKFDLKIKTFNKIWHSIKHVEFWREQSFKDTRYLESKLHELNNRRILAIDNLRKFRESVSIELHGKRIPQDIPEELGRYIQAVDEITVNYQNLPNARRADIVHQNLILPLMTLNRSYNSQNIEGRELMELIARMGDNLLKASREFQNMEIFLMAQKNQFETYSKSFRRDYRLCIKAKEILLTTGIWYKLKLWFSTFPPPLTTPHS